MVIQEINIRQPGDPKYRENVIDFSDEYEMITTKILMILNTKKGEVLGDYNFGTSLEDLLFTFAIDDSEIESKVLNQIRMYVPESNNFNLQLTVKRFKGKIRDLILLDFILDGRKSFGVLVK